MGSLKDQMLQAGLVSRRQVDHQERVARTKKKKAKHGALDPEEEARKAALAAQAEEAARAQAERVEEERLRRLEHEGRVRVRNLLLRPSTFDSRPGQRRFHYLTRGGGIQWFWVTGTTGQMLESGLLGVAEEPFGSEPVFRLVERDTLAAIQVADPRWIRFWNGHPDHAGLPVGEDEGPVSGLPAPGPERAPQER